MVIIIAISLGLLAIAGIIVAILLSNILVFECVLCSIVAYLLAYLLLDLHPVFSILIGTAILLLFLALALKTRFGFWALSAIFSLAWGAAASSLSETLFEGDYIWMVFFAVVGFLLSMALHWSMRKKLSYRKPPMPQQWQGGNAPNNQFTDFDRHHRG